MTVIACDAEPDPNSGEPIDRVRPLSPDTYLELKRAAGAILRRRQNRGVDPTSLVHRVWGKLYHYPPDHWKSHSHFVAAAKKAMNHALVDEHRKPQPLWVRDEVLDLMPGTSPEDLAVLEDLLAQLARYDARQARIARRKLEGYFDKEQAKLERVSLWTIEDEWRHARAWLRGKIQRCR